MHYPSHIDIGVYVGTIGLFFVFFLLFARFFPVLALNEVKSILKSSGESYKNAPDPHHDDPNPVAPKVEAAANVADEFKSEVPKTKSKGLSDEEMKAKAGALISKLGEGSVDTKDDLKVISGVGPVLEGKLNEIGIFTYGQVSKMTKEEYDLLDELTSSFPGRAERDDWAGQAKELMNKSNS
jgi:molybdopterin-containing oxidoreductase family membrane subunit